MKAQKNILIFYIYLTEKFKTIKAQVINNNSASGKNLRSQLFLVLEKAGIAAITTILVYSTMMLLNMGRLIWPSNHMFLEIGLAFFFLLCLFWSHRKISDFINSRQFRIELWLKTIAEVVLVIGITLVLHLLINFLPLRLIYYTAVFEPASVRASFLMSIIISLFFYYLVERERSKRQLQAELLRTTQLQKEVFEAQIQSLKNQMNPHFLFNSLNVLSSLVRNDRNQAREFVYRLSKVYRAFLDHSHEQLISLEKEMELTEAYLYLLRIRFGDKIKVDLKVSEAYKGLFLPPGSLQMLVENAVKHNASTRKRPLKIVIVSERKHLIVKNNLQPRLEEVHSTKTGLQNIKRRYQYLSDQQVEITKTETEFIVQLPLVKSRSE